MNRSLKSFAAATAVLMVGVGLGACSNSSSSSSSAPPASSTVPAIGAGDFTADFSAMEQLKDLAAKGKGMIGVLLPDTTTSARYESYDRPFLTKAFEAAGLSSDHFKIDNAQGSATTMQTQAEADITDGASVLLVDALDSGSGAAIEAERGRPRASRSSTTTASSWAAPTDRVLRQLRQRQGRQADRQGRGRLHHGLEGREAERPDHGRRPDRQQRQAVRRGLQRRPEAEVRLTAPTSKVGEPAGTWTPAVAATTFTQQFTAHPNINAVVTPNDDNANAVIARAAGAEHPGQDVPDHRSGRVDRRPAEHPEGLPVRHGVQADLPRGAGRGGDRARTSGPGRRPRRRWSTARPRTTRRARTSPSVLLVPTWVTTENMADTVIKDDRRGDRADREGRLRRSRPERLHEAG